MNILFLHVAEHKTGRFRINLIPNGVFGLAGLLDSNGYYVKILHRELESKLNPDFNLMEYIRVQGIDLVCMDLYFHHQTPAVLDMASSIKKKFTGMKILLGGLTASVFAKEIISEYPSIDYVLIGDCEKPILDLCAIVSKNNSPENLQNIPNLFWRSEKGAEKPAHNYIIDEETHNEMSFTNYALLKNADYYLRMRMNSESFRDSRQTYYSVGRSCAKNCTFCGASRSTERLVNNRKMTTLKSAESVVRDLRLAVEHYQVTSWNLGFDPVANRNYLSRLLECLRKEDFRLDFVFDSFSLLSEEVVNEIRDSFNEGPIINLSPYSGSRRVRIANHLHRYTNEELLEQLAYYKNHGIRSSVYFTVGLYSETSEDVAETENLIKVIRSDFPLFHIYVQPIEIEPASVLALDKENYGLTNMPVTIADYYNHHKEYGRAGYQTSVYTFDQILSDVNRLSDIAAI